MFKINTDINNIWFSSDHHFNHINILKYENRPFSSIEEHDSALIENWNKNVKNTDIVFYAGDIYLGNNKDYLRKILYSLNGKIYYVFGNHDTLVRKDILTQERFKTHGDYLEISINKKYNITISHYAMKVWNKRHYGSWSLYGHSHGNLGEDDSRSMDIGIDAVYKRLGQKIENYRPINFNEVHEIMKTRENKPVDHHI